ncbi:MAG TPA: cation diffusion facilitator family transporter [Gemmatimonadaceae bacterium]|nr:cation diffusion facilitator family transporter [Gemmatimonadaceae bacterium]
MAEPLAAAVVSVMLLAAAVGIAIEAISEIRTPHRTPAAWTLVVLVAVMATKWILARRVRAIGIDIGSTAVRADAWHHLSDAVTSAAAFVGISIALWGGPGWESADDWAALAASGVIFFNGVNMLRPTLQDLMDRMPGPDVVDPIRHAAESVEGVRATEKLAGPQDRNGVPRDDSRPGRRQAPARRSSHPRRASEERDSRGGADRRIRAGAHGAVRWQSAERTGRPHIVGRRRTHLTGTCIHDTDAPSVVPCGLNAR